MTKLLSFFLAFAASMAGSDYPGASWEPHSRQGWSEPLLKAAREYMRSKQTAAVMIIQGGRVVDQWGDVGRKWEVRSIRKSLLSALYGIHVAEGHIELGKTLAEIGIDDTPPLTPIEKQATILDLLRARSGVYHEPMREAPGMRASRPVRGSHPPGTFFYYNNWDFNTLGTIFQKLTHTNLFEEFERQIARPIGMEDYTAGDGRFAGREGSMVGGESIHPNYIFSMTARDMARFGYLYLRGGRWKDKQIVPSDWVERSTTTYTQVGEADDPALNHIGDPTAPAGRGYGFLWWTLDWGYLAMGNGGHVIAVVPSKDLVIVHRVVYDLPREDVVTFRDVDTMIRIVIAAAPGK